MIDAEQLDSRVLTVHAQILSKEKNKTKIEGNYVMS